MKIMQYFHRGGNLTQGPTIVVAAVVVCSRVTSKPLRRPALVLAFILIAGRCMFELHTHSFHYWYVMFCGGPDNRQSK